MLSRYAVMGLVLVAVLLVSTAAADWPTIGFAVKGGGHWVEDPREASRSLHAQRSHGHYGSWRCLR